MKIYDVEMTVPLGIRHGTMFLDTQGENVEGTFEIMGNKTSFTGTIHENEISISGELEILIRKVAYQGTGTITEQEICMELKNKKSVYKLKGSLRE